jgi:hypothetical protein
MPTPQQEADNMNSETREFQNQTLMGLCLILSAAEDIHARCRAEYDSVHAYWRKINGQLNFALGAADFPEITALQQLMRTVTNEAHTASDALIAAQTAVDDARARMSMAAQPALARARMPPVHNELAAIVRPAPADSTQQTLPHNSTVSPVQPPSAASSRPAIRTMLTLPYDVREMIHDYGRPTANEQAAHARSDYILAVVSNAVQFLQPAARSWFNTILTEGYVAELDPSVAMDQAIQLAWATRKAQQNFRLGDPQWAAWESGFARMFLDWAQSRLRYRQRTNSGLPTPVHRWFGVPGVPVVLAPGVPLPVVPVATAAPAPAAPAPASSAPAAPAPAAQVVQASVSSPPARQAARRQRRLSVTPRATPIFVDEVGAGSDEVKNPAYEDDLLDEFDDEYLTHRQRRNRAQRQQLSRAARRGFSSEDNDPVRSGLCRYVKQKRK